MISPLRQHAESRNLEQILFGMPCSGLRSPRFDNCVTVQLLQSLFQQVAISLDPVAFRILWLRCMCPIDFRPQPRPTLLRFSLPPICPLRLEPFPELPESTPPPALSILQRFPSFLPFFSPRQKWRHHCRILSAHFLGYPQEFFPFLGHLL